MVEIILLLTAFILVSIFVFAIQWVMDKEEEEDKK